MSAGADAAAGTDLTGGRPRGRLVPIAFACAVLLALPTLDAPLLEDDVVHRAMLGDSLPGLRWGPLELYDFVGAPGRSARALRDAGVMPWFTGEDLSLRFFRPLSSATIALDAQVFGGRLWPARLHSLAWFLAALGLAAALHRRILPQPTAGVATLIYAVAAAHAMPTTWLSARHTVVAATCGLAACWLHVRARDDNWRLGRVLAPLALVAGFFAGELALGAAVLVLCWELTGRRDPLRVRIVATAPFGVITLAYLAWYAATGYGAYGSGLYTGIDAGPALAVTVARHFFILVAEMAAATPSDAFSLAAAGVQTAAAAWGAAAVLLGWFVVRRAGAHVQARERSAIGWMALAAAGAALPGTLSLVGGRVLTVALVPASAIVAIAIVSGLAAARDVSLPALGRRAAGVIVAGLAVGHFLAAPMLRLAIGSALAGLARTQHAVTAAAPACKGTMVLVAAPDLVLSTYVPATLALTGPVPEGFRVLSLATSDHRIDNVTATGFDLTTLDANRTRTIWERLYRRSGLPAGTRVAIPSLEATVIQDHDGAPTRVRFDFGEPLDSQSLCFLRWHGGALVPFKPPAPGGTVEIPYEPGPMGS